MIVSDATTLIILFDMDRVGLLSNLFEKIYIPESVFDEINFKSIIELPDFMSVVKVQDCELLNDLKNILDIGESEAITLAKKMDLPLIIDEKKGRKIAQNLELKIIGLIGIIYLNIKKEFMSKNEAIVFFEKAIKNGYRVNQKLIDTMMENL